MAEEPRRPPKRLLLDTNIFIVGYVEETSAEKRILQFAIEHRSEIALLLSDEMLEQFLRVARRVRGKDWAGLLLFYLWRDFNIVYVNLENAQQDAQEFLDKIPRKDLLIFLTAFAGRADCLICRNRKFLKSVLQQQPGFQCLAPEEFLVQFVPG